MACMHENRPTSSSRWRWRSRGRLHPEISRGGHQPSPMTIQTNSRWVHDRRHTGRSRLEPLTAPTPNERDVTGQLLLAIAQLLINCIPAVRSTSNKTRRPWHQFCTRTQTPASPRESTGSHLHSRTYLQMHLPRLPGPVPPVPA